MKSTLVFVDDDEAERIDFGPIVEPEYEYVAIAWPLGRPIEDAMKERLARPPDIIVLDLYLPLGDGSAREEIAPKELMREQALMHGAIDDLLGLYPNYKGNPKALLRETMDGLGKVRAVLDAQWAALGQSPTHGVALMQRLRALYPDVPIVFYSRKITPEDVIRVLQAGAADAIRKKALTDDDVRARLRQVRDVYASAQARELRDRGLKVNVTLFAD